MGRWKGDEGEGEKRGTSERGKSSHFSKRFDASAQQTPPLFQQLDFVVTVTLFYLFSTLLIHEYKSR